jgi:SAM-dependent methyltransferase
VNYLLTSEAPTMTDPRPIRRNPDVLTDTLAVAGKQLIDVGCGNGHLVRHLARHGAQVLGVECSPRQLAAAHAAARVADETIVEGVGQALPAADASADIVVFFNSLHHIPGEHMATALNEACRVLRADGVVYVAEPLAEGEFFALCRAVDDETQVRAAAQHAVLTHPCLRLAQTFDYLHPVVLADFAAFRERLVSANHEREARFAAHQAELSALFARSGQPVDDGRQFIQPMRVHLLHPLPPG